MSIRTISAGDVLELTNEIAGCLQQYFPTLTIYVVNDVPGEDHVYAQYRGLPAFDLLVTTARKFVFMWYYALPQRVAGDKGVQMVDHMRTISLDNNFDLVVKYAWAQVKPGAPALIIRQNKQTVGESIFVHPKFQKFIVKQGNPLLDTKKHSELFLATYRKYDWFFRGALTKIRSKVVRMMMESLQRTRKIHLHNQLCGYILYAGCAFHYVYPQLGFGMRDIDVNVFFNKEARRAGVLSSRGVLSRHCEIDQFGKPEYFGNKTRLIDVMWNVLKEDSGNYVDDILNYMHSMRSVSDRWATISQRPFVDLTTRKVIYVPEWLKRIEKSGHEKHLFRRRGGK